MKVILTDYVYKYGVAGEVVQVADGYARNWLIPQKLAIPATPKNLKSLVELRSKAAENRAQITDRINTAARQIDGVEIVFGVKAGSNNKLYGSITSQMIKDKILEKTGIDINRRRLSERTIRELGRYEVPVRMGEVSPVVHVVVMREEEITAYLAGKATPAEAPAEAVPVPEPAESGTAEAATATTE